MDKVVTKANKLFLGFRTTSLNNTRSPRYTNHLFIISCSLVITLFAPVCYVIATYRHIEFRSFGTCVASLPLIICNRASQVYFCGILSVLLFVLPSTTTNQRMVLTGCGVAYNRRTASNGSSSTWNKWASFALDTIKSNKQTDASCISIHYSNCSSIICIIITSVHWIYTNSYTVECYTTRIIASC
jgi:hypothetical protein